MTSNALHEARRLANDAAMTTNVRIDLGTLQALIAELDMLRARVAGCPVLGCSLKVIENANALPDQVIVMKHKDIRSGNDGSG